MSCSQAAREFWSKFNEGVMILGAPQQHTKIHLTGGYQKTYLNTLCKIGRSQQLSVMVIKGDRQKQFLLHNKWIEDHIKGVHAKLKEGFPNTPLEPLEYTFFTGINKAS